MPILKTTVPDETKDAFNALAERYGLSESEFLRTIVISVMRDAKTPETEIRKVAEKDTEQARITVRFPVFLLDELKRRSAYRGMAVSRFISAMVQSQIRRVPVMTVPEIRVLNKAIYELSAIGRNLNQIARALNADLRETDRLKLSHLTALSILLEDIKTGMRQLVRESSNAWGDDE